MNLGYQLLVITTLTLVCVCVFIPLPFLVGTLLLEASGTPIGVLELKPTGKVARTQPRAA